MRNVPNLKADRYRVRSGLLGSDPSWGNNGAFAVPLGRLTAWVIVSDGMGWDHVSVSIRGAARCPTWEEMVQVKELFFRDDETVVQFHPRRSEYVSDHPYCLHLWRRQDQEHELPPSLLVGFGCGEEEARRLGSGAFLHANTQEVPRDEAP